MGKHFYLKKAGLVVCFIVICILFLYSLYKYMNVYNIEYNEQLQIQMMEQNLFPDILDIQIPYDSHYISAADYDTEAIHETKVSAASSNSNHVWLGDCILSIPKINLNKVVYTGTERLEHLKDYGLATAADTMKYENGGNYIICGHASRLYGHSLNRIKELDKEDTIYIKTKNSKDCYRVTKVSYENMNETSKYCSQTSQRQITIISCAKYVSKESYIVITAIPE